MEQCLRCSKPVERKRSKFCSKFCQQAHWRENNRERDLKSKRAYWERNIEKHRERGIAYYYKTKDRQLAAQKARYQQSRIALPWRVIFNSAKARAKTSGMPFSLTHDWIKARWTGRCELSGIEFIQTKRGEAKIFSASIDRIDSDKGYEPDNCRIILHGLNTMKSNGTDADVIRICFAVIANMRIVLPKVS